MEAKESLGEILEKRGKGFFEEEIVKWGLELCQILENQERQKPAELLQFKLNKLFFVNEKLEAENGKAKNLQESIHSLGACLFHLATAKPFQIDYLLDGYPLVRQFNSELSEEIEMVITKAIGWQVEERYTKIDALKEDLGRASKRITEEKAKKAEEAAKVAKKEKKKVFFKEPVEEKILKIPVQKEDQEARVEAGAETEVKKEILKPPEKKIIDFSQCIWRPRNIGLQGKALDVRDIIVFRDGSWMIATRAGVYRSQDQGKNWQACNQGLEEAELNVQTIAQLADRAVLIGFLDEDGVYRSDDQGESWRSQNKELKGIARDIKVIYLDGNQVWIGTDGDGIYRSIISQDELDWKSYNKGLRDKVLCISAIASLKDGTLFIGTGDGVYRSTDQGANWHGCREGFEDKEAGGYVKTLLVLGDDALIVSFFDRNVYQSKDRGESWQRKIRGTWIWAIGFLDKNHLLIESHSESDSEWQWIDNEFKESARKFNTEGFLKSWKPWIRAMAINHNGLAVIGTDNGIYVLEKKEVEK